MKVFDIPIARVLTILAATAALLALASAPYGSVAVLGALVVWALLGAPNAIQALSLTAIIRFLNPALFTPEGPIALMGWLVLGAAALRVLVETALRKASLHPVLPALLAFCVVVLFESAVGSRFPLVSVLKLLAFAGLGITVLQAFALSSRTSPRWDAWFVGLWLGVFLLSVPTYFLSNIGYHLNGTGFQGILSHPQTLGAVLAPAAAYFAAAQLTRNRATPVGWVILALALALVYLSGARTAALSFVLGLIAASPVLLAKRTDLARSSRRALQGAAAALLAGVVLLQVAGLSAIAERAHGFVFKYDPTSSFSANNTRAHSIREHLESFERNPLLGIGFGVSPDTFFRPSENLSDGLLLSAPVEKGFLPTAILEEIGLVGATAFVALVFAPLLWVMFRSQDYVRTSVALTVLALNLGEMFFFSVGGFGMFAWLLLAWAVTPDGDATLAKAALDRLVAVGSPASRLEASTVRATGC